ncbi:MAG: type I methionyl aminopeptidase [Mycoplasmataceae bacterium]|nr:type I methionyl aminopeptidase [Mycoplasmataceae bacterium]
MIYIKSSTDINLIKTAATIWKKVRVMLIANTKVGVNLNALDEQVAELVASLGATCSFWQYHGFPKHLCISVNDELIHGIPRDYVIQPNDLITFDLGITYQQHVCDAAFTIHVAPTSDVPAKINVATQAALWQAIQVIKPGIHIGDISHTIANVAQAHGYTVMKDFGGHGCGNYLHEDPIILNYGKPHTGPKVVPGMTLCIEPMLMTGSDAYFIDPVDQWTVKSKNHQLTCQWEHMVLVTTDGCEVLTGEWHDS